MIIAAYVDWCGDEDKEYDEIKRFFENELKWEFLFRSRVRPLDLLQSSADAYVLDFGGVQSGYGDGGWSFYEREVLKLVEERPNLLVLMWTAFTGYGYWEVAKEMSPKLATAPNVIFCDGNSRWSHASRYDKAWQKRAKEWMAGKHKKRTTRERVLLALAAEETMIGVKTSEIVSTVGVTESTVRKTLAALKKEKKVEQVAEGYYRLVRARGGEE